MRKASEETWFWTPQRLNRLVETLKDLAYEDAEGLYFTEGISSLILFNYHEKGVRLTYGLAGMGARILTFLGAFSPTTIGKKPRGYKRRYLPDQLSEITWEDVNRYREKRRR